LVQDRDFWRISSLFGIGLLPLQVLIFHGESVPGRLVSGCTAKSEASAKNSPRRAV
jgi:hypothetical protein